jgi:hypothetical protein
MLYLMSLSLICKATAGCIYFIEALLRSYPIGPKPTYSLWLNLMAGDTHDPMWGYRETLKALVVRYCICPSDPHLSECCLMAPKRTDLDSLAPTDCYIG